MIEKRLKLAAEADFAMAFYNPRSKARPKGFEKTLQILNRSCGDNRLVIFARAVFTKQEQIKVVPLSAATADMADMHTVVLVGSSQTRLLSHKNRTFVYTPVPMKTEPASSTLVQADLSLPVQAEQAGLS